MQSPLSALSAPSAPSATPALSAPAENPQPSGGFVRADQWLNRFHRLGPAFFTELPAQGIPEPYWVARSDDCAASLGWPEYWREGPDALTVFSGNALWPGMKSLATVYSGHQFGSWAGQLGDGRAHWLGEIDTPAGPREIQLKGAGRTPYSRMGDGRAVLRSSIREFLCSEAMHHLGVPTTRALCLTGSSLPVRRETRESAAVLTRVAPSFIRFGHFEHFCHHGHLAELRQLLNYVLENYFPQCVESAEPALALLREVTLRTARLIAQWQGLGFCHGVMNTDNMSILGLTLDYGPFGFLDSFDPQHICNHSDDRGRYAFSRQPQVAWWNLHALAQALVPLVGEGQGDEADADKLREVLAEFGPAFSSAMQAGMRAKLGLLTDQAGDAELANNFLRLLEADKVDYSIAWRRLCRFDSSIGAENVLMRDLFCHHEGFAAWAETYAQRLRAEENQDKERCQRMQQVNPKFILRNHLAQQAIESAERGDFSLVEKLLKVLQRPFDEQPEQEEFAGFPPEWAGSLCISCSS